MVTKLTGCDLTGMEACETPHSLPVRAAAEIRELRTMLEGYDDLLADNARLKEEIAGLTKKLERWENPPEAETAGVYRREIPASNVTGSLLAIGVAGEPAKVDQ